MSGIADGAAAFPVGPASRIAVTRFADFVLF